MRITTTLFTKTLSRCFLLAALLAGAAAAAAQGYREIKPAQPTRTGDRIEVLEIFWYGCPGCYGFEPELKAWKKDLPQDVQFRRMPAVMKQSWVAHAKAYYAAEKMGVLEQMHTPLFDALHKDRKRVFTRAQILAFVAELGIDKDEFGKHFDSNETEIKTREAYILAQRYRASGVPSMVVNGKYLTSGALSGPTRDMLEVVDELIERERQP